MKISVVHSVIFSAIFCFSAQADDVDWSAKSSESQAGKVLSTSKKASSSSNINQGQALKTAAKVTPQSQAAKTLAARPAQSDINQEFWVYDAYVSLHTDSDYDGYYHHFSVDFDVDSVYARSEVYARLYLGVNDVFREYHTTGDFYIEGDITEDQITVETEILSGFYPDDYEILIEIYDAYTNELVAVSDGYSDADLYLLSIESQDKEVIYVEPDVVVIEASGGSAGWLIALLLPIALLRLIRRSI
ncbi:hypothetical protein GMES_0877 [Paraglaciecola mesophila KMM 241]|uniref:GlyGly-CTERM sorting domain-containing protein n=1 Tax=Paraglaciecola mesophila KMM 241 TaxID=1128912 RepID=K6YYC5_9ALTE|nr:choice-of-anchor H family protein [Paraglaciecola mesophila]GAC23177.1 hypothetical protein GMES_0877 [Paraglaciecola mesophila KMM 241]|tara:strand:- start:261 stop:998 length:738 start_codon:yes stop_codon:yes gene_type:complete